MKQNNGARRRRDKAERIAREKRIGAMGLSVNREAREQHEAEKVRNAIRIADGRRK
jgi:hypothetical protein